MIPDPETAQQGLSIWKDLITAFLIPALGAIVGVFIKEAIDIGREKKKYGISDLEFLCQQIDSIREDSISYWKIDADPNDKIMEAKIIGMLHGCEEIIASSNIHNEKTRSLMIEDLRQFRKVCTSGGFGQFNRKADIDRLGKIEIEGRVIFSKILAFRRG